MLRRLAYDVALLPLMLVLMVVVFVGAITTFATTAYKIKFQGLSVNYQ